MGLLIPRLLHQIWVGPDAPPHRWMATWKRHHPEWYYCLWGNLELAGRRWRLQRAIDHYSSRACWAGVADCVRYEVLHEYGGFMPGADAVCERPVDGLFGVLPGKAPHGWAVYENEAVKPDYITPVYAAQPGSEFCESMMLRIEDTPAEDLGLPWLSVGNKVMGEVVRYKPEWLTVWPSWYFNPRHYSGVEYPGDGVPYGRQMWGSTEGGGGYDAGR